MVSFRVFYPYGRQKSIDAVWCACIGSIVKVPGNQIYLLASFLLHRYGRTALKDKDVFYKHLLIELQMFERNFGKYINDLTVNDEKKRIYNDKARTAILKLCDFSQLSSVDIFNYDEPDIDEIKSKTNHINGNTVYPIFGIDVRRFLVNKQMTFLKNSDNQYPFTKESRKGEWDTLRNDIVEEDDFQHLVVFGHSLSPSDYSYFFPIFDKLKIMDSNSDGKIIFAFNVYDETQDRIIKETINSSVMKMFQEYLFEKNELNLIEDLQSNKNI